MTAELSDCKEMATCTEVIVYATAPGEPPLNEVTTIHAIINSTNFSTIIFRGIYMLDHLATISPSGHIELVEPPRENTKIALLADSQTLKGYLPNIIFTHDGKVFAGSSTYYGDWPIFNPGDFEEHIFQAVEYIPDEFRGNFDYLNTLLY
jgi:hypothetical protein